MNILTEIHRHENLNILGKAVYRTAIRGVALRGRELLMVHSTEVGDYKFPGGGMNEGEEHEQALRREIREECGMSLLHFGQGVEGCEVEKGGEGTSELRGAAENVKGTTTAPSGRPSGSCSENRTVELCQLGFTPLGVGEMDQSFS